VFSTADDNQLAVTVHVLQGEREMAAGNKSLGRFDLGDIPPAPRGLPQIEVTFDIDANGILHVSAKDKATNKENKITIKAGSGLSEAEIQQMVKDAEAHAEEDRKARELAEARNHADSLVHSVRKSVKEMGDKLDPAEKEKIEAAIKDLEEASRSDDQEDIKKKTDALLEASHKLAEQMYAQAQAKAKAEESAGTAETPGAEKGDAKEKENVVDAEFEEVKENKGKK
jgi:molecular chaperone DnaK